MSQNFPHISFQLFSLSVLLGVFHVTSLPTVAEAAPSLTTPEGFISTDSAYHTEFNKNLSNPEVILTKSSHSPEITPFMDKLLSKRNLSSSRLPKPVNAAEKSARAERIMDRLRQQRVKTTQSAIVIPKSSKEFSTAKKAVVATPITDLKTRPSITTAQNARSGRFIYTDKQRTTLPKKDNNSINNAPPQIDTYTKLEASPFELQKPDDMAKMVPPSQTPFTTPLTTPLPAPLTTPPFAFNDTLTEVTPQLAQDKEPLFEPFESFEATLPTAIAPPEPMVFSTAQGLSEETKEILYSLPEKITGLPPKRKKSGRFAIKRELSAQAALKSSTPSTESDSMNISVQKRMAVNYDRVLEQAFEAISTGDTEAASALYKDILTAEPHNVEARFGLATTYHRLGMLEKARSEYGYLLHKQPDHLEGLNNFLALVGEESPVEAVKYLVQLAERNSDYSPLWAQVSSIYQQQGDIASAVEAMERARVVTPENIVYSFNLAVLYDELGDASKASAFYRSVLLASERGQPIPVEIADVQNRLTYLSSL